MGGSSPSSSLSSCRSSTSSKPFEKSSLTAGASTTSEQQTQSNMSDKAKAALVAPNKESLMANLSKDEWEHFYTLALQYDQLKQQGVEASKDPSNELLVAFPIAITRRTFRRLIAAHERHVLGEWQGHVHDFLGFRVAQ